MMQAYDFKGKLLKKRRLFLTSSGLLNLYTDKEQLRNGLIGTLSV